MPVSRGAQAVEPTGMTDPVSITLGPEPSEPVPVLKPEPSEPVMVAAEPEPVAVPAPVVEQETTEGTVTPWTAHTCDAKVIAELWSAASQPPGWARQQAMLERKSWLVQMHLASPLQPAMPLGPMFWPTQFV